MLKNELDIHVDDEIFWTDSKVVLGYINSDVRRFKVFVANRVQQIRDHTSPKQWHYVESSSNPADDASRGLDSKKKDQIKRWFDGPSFLWSRKQCWLEKFQLEEVPDEDPEVRKVVNVNVSNSRINKVSFLNQLNDSIDTEMIQKAQEKIFLLVQAESFANEIKQLKLDKKMVPESSSISQLDPFLDNRGILRVGGRLRKSNLTGENHPVILPKKCAVSNMIIQWSHHSVAHGARGMTLNHLRQRGIWIVNANAIVRYLIHKCVICRKLHGKMGYQKMADLPQEKCPEAALFTYCGVDMFGPLIIKERRSELKRYGALFTCFSSPAVHIEITNSLDADSSILALRRIMARRGTVRSIWSDNETNFVGAKNELQRALKEMKHDKIKSFLQGNGAEWILWHNNPPGVSHMGGVWERQIQSARTILEGLLKTHSHSLNDESLRTLMAEVELIINSRPLTVETISGSKSEIPVSPSNLLIMKTSVVMSPPGEFSKLDAYSKRRWRRV